MATQKIVSRGITALILLLLLGYVYFEARSFLSGPQLDVEEPQDGFSVTESPMLVSGSAHRITKITLNGNPIFVDESGVFQRTLPLLPGYQVIEVAVQDRFGRTEIRRISGVYTPEIPIRIPTPAATSTPKTDSTLDAATTTGGL